MFTFFKKAIHILVIPLMIIVELIILAIMSLLGHPTFGAEPTKTDRIHVLFLFLTLLIIPYLAIKLYGITKSKKQK